MSEFRQGQVLITIDEGHSRSAMQGALAVCVDDDHENYTRVKWVRNALARNQNDGQYSREDFRLATREEVQDATNLAEQQFAAMRELLISMPTFAEGDYVFKNRSGHQVLPYRVLNISNGMVMVWRPEREGPDADGYQTFKSTDLIQRPTSLALYWAENPVMKGYYERFELRP